MVRTLFAALGAGLLAAVLAADGRAALYHPDDRTGVVPVDDAGNPDPFPFDEFRRRHLILKNASNAEWPLVEIDPKTGEKVIDPKTGQPKLSDRGVLDARIKKALLKPEKARTANERAALAVDYLRFGSPDLAAGALKGDRADYLSNVTLAHIAIAQYSRERPTANWSRATDYLDIATEYATDKRKPLTSVMGVSGAQLAWQLKLDRGALAKFVRLRLAEARAARPEEDALPDRIFDVNFVNDAGHYEPGKLAAGEKAKLPGGDFTEALATVQQLVLWFPNDTRLYWLLGELYAARGDPARDDLKTARVILDQCVNTGRFSNHKVLVQHREIVTKLAEVEPPEEVPPPPPVSWREIAIYFAAIGAVVAFALGRTIWRAAKGRTDSGACGPVG